jgi:3-hydroxyanthranilate 3,4-dioxygenase
MMPLNLLSWVAEHRHLLKPPVGNKVIWQDQDFICMVVGGPNARDDFHVEDGPEFFYQLEGEMVLRVMETTNATDLSGRAKVLPKDIPIRAGEIYLLPPRVPHSPQRMAGGVGLVIERKRQMHELDGLQWYCKSCHHKLYEAFFALKNIETQFAAVFQDFYSSVARRTCSQCGAVHPAR